MTDKLWNLNVRGLVASLSFVVPDSFIFVQEITYNNVFVLVW